MKEFLVTFSMNNGDMVVLQSETAEECQLSLYRDVAKELKGEVDNGLALIVHDLTGMIHIRVSPKRIEVSEYSVQRKSSMMSVEGWKENLDHHIDRDSHFYSVTYAVLSEVLC